MVQPHFRAHNSEQFIFQKACISPLNILTWINVPPFSQSDSSILRWQYYRYFQGKKILKESDYEVSFLYFEDKYLSFHDRVCNLKMLLNHDCGKTMTTRFCLVTFHLIKEIDSIHEEKDKQSNCTGDENLPAIQWRNISLWLCDAVTRISNLWQF